MHKILVIEDEVILADMLKTKLSSESYEIKVANDGEQALEIVYDFNPDLILLDIILPKIDGITFLKTYRRDPRGKKTKVIILSNLDYSVHAAELAKQHVCEYMLKTKWSLHDLVDKVHSTIGE